MVPSKWANPELMKIPNFLHLTPPVVARHCQALGKFCTPWPQGLETEEVGEMLMLGGYLDGSILYSKI